MKLLAFETHPIQYRAPIFQAYERMFPGELEVIYASDFSVRGYQDREFHQSFSWDVPLLSGYRFQVLNAAPGDGADRWNRFRGDGVTRVVCDRRPDAVLLHSLHYAFCWSAYLTALRRGIPVWLRVETQDEAFSRGPLKSAVRALVYRLLYAGVRRGFYIGELNRRHLLAHGMRAERLRSARYCTPDPLKDLTSAERCSRRAQARARLGIGPDTRVIAFFGKLIVKKNPQLLVDAARILRQRNTKADFLLLFVGSGELEAELREGCTRLEASCAVRSMFAGFVNQSGLPDFYLASDIVVLPSRRMGETWGLVVNEALQAGCSVVISDAVGCAGDFGAWERVRVFAGEDADALALAIRDLLDLARDLDWARERMRAYSSEQAAISFHEALTSAADDAPAAAAPTSAR